MARAFLLKFLWQYCLHQLTGLLVGRLGKFQSTSVPLVREFTPTSAELIISTSPSPRRKWFLLVEVALGLGACTWRCSIILTDVISLFCFSFKPNILLAKLKSHNKCVLLAPYVFHILVNTLVVSLLKRSNFSTKAYNYIVGHLFGIIFVRLFTLTLLHYLFIECQFPEFLGIAIYFGLCLQNLSNYYTGWLVGLPAKFASRPAVPMVLDRFLSPPPCTLTK